MPGDDAVDLVFNQEIRDPLNFLLNPPAVSVYRSGVVTGTVSGTATLISWDAELYDTTDTMHSTATLPSRIFAPETGLYDVRVGMAWAADADGYRAIRVGVNTGGTDPQNAAAIRVQYTSAGGSVESQFTLAKDVRLVQGDYIEVFQQHAAGNALDLSPGAGKMHASMRWVGK